ncbi:hypothetical protein CI610_03755 [invertebrate metagenome]|uniref:Uncharacterized protein n=1 Tax=invertebrate metagenome TaxID=1711999 RepID=A0A2H9T288_9ZZZZ
MARYKKRLKLSLYRSKQRHKYPSQTIHSPRKLNKRAFVFSPGKSNAKRMCVSTQKSDPTSVHTDVTPPHNASKRKMSFSPGNSDAAGHRVETEYEPSSLLLEKLVRNGKFSPNNIEYKVFQDTLNDFLPIKHYNLIC